MPEGYSYEIREAAEAMYVTDGMTYDQVAAATGVSVAQLKRWGMDEDWTGKKKEYREALSSIRRDKIKLRAALLKTALDSKDPQSVYAYAAIERAMAASRKSEEDQIQPAHEIPVQEFKGPEDAINALWDGLKYTISGMLLSPATMDFKKIKQLKDAFGLLSDMKATYAPKTDAPRKVKALDENTIQTIKDIYGIS
jgi:hypothetical protein